MAPPLLNVDVLAIACEFLTDVSDVLSMALTSSSVRPVAIRWLLRMGPVYLKSGPSIRRFHLFLFADEAARAPHIRALHIDLRRPGQPKAQDEDCSLLLHILGSCGDLEHLTIAFQPASIPIVTDSCLLYTITNIPSLKSFSVRSVSFDGILLLPRVSTPLRMIGIHTDNMLVVPRYPPVLERLLPRAVVHTLETLGLDRFAVDPLDPQFPPSLRMSPIVNMAQYPAVRSLSVGSFRGRPLLDHLQHLFPALDGTLQFDWFEMYSLAHNYDDIRAANQHTEDSGGSRAWKKLDRLVCEGSMLYMLSLRCPIRLAMIFCGPVEKYEYAAVALRDNPVPRLKLTLYHNPGMFEGLFSPELADRLTHLTLCLLYSTEYEYSHPGQGRAEAGSPPRFQWDHVLATLVASLKPLHKLTHIRVVIGASVHVHKGAHWPFAPREEYAHSFRASRFDFEGTAAALARVLPSLKYVFITTGGYLANWVGEPEEEDGDPEEVPRPERWWELYERWYISHGWRVLTPGTGEVQEEGRGLVDLHEEVAETIIRKEELILSARDEAALHLSSGWHESPPPLSL